MERLTWQGTKSSLQLTAIKKLNLANNYMNLEVDPPPVELSEEMSALVDTLIVALLETLKKRTQISNALIPDSQEL